MVLFAILVLLDFTLSTDFMFNFRLEVAGLPLNVLDGLIVLTFVHQLVRSRRSDFRADRVHPLLVWSVVILVLAVLVGVMGSMMNGTRARDWITAMRNVAMLPLAIFIGYMVVRTPRSTRTITYIWLLGAVLSGIALLFLVRDTAEQVKWGKSFDQLRGIRQGGDAGLTAMAFFAFALVAGVRVLPRVLMVAFLLLSAAAFFSLPHRGNYVVGACTLLFAVLALPRVPWGRRLGMMAVGMVFMAVALLSMGAVISQLTGRDFKTYVVEKRIKELLPGFDEETKTTVLATRLPGILAELSLWLENPLTGQGFAIGRQYEEEHGEIGMGTNHNVWTSALAQMGPIGFLGYAIPVIGSIVVGFRIWRDQTDRDMSILGAIGAITGAYSFLWATISQTINQQRLAILVGLMFGIVFRVRAMQLTVARQQVEEAYGEPLYEPMGYDREDSLRVA